MTTHRVYYSQDAAMQAMRNRTILTVIFLMFGLGIGAAFALLFAPASGETTRQDFAKGIEDKLTTGRESIEPVIKRLEAEFAELRKNVDERLKHS